MGVLCAIFGHKRSAKLAKFSCEAQRWESVCRLCRQPMVRLGHRNWHLKAELDNSSRCEPNGCKVR